MNSTSFCLSGNLSPTGLSAHNSIARKCDGYAASVTTTRSASIRAQCMIVTANLARSMRSPHFTEEKTEVKSKLGTRTQICLHSSCLFKM